MSGCLFRILVSVITIIVLSGGIVQAAGGGYLYALINVIGGPNRIFGFQVNEVTGELTGLSGFPVDTGGNGSVLSDSEQLAYDSANGRLFALNEGSDTISAYSVDLTTGALTVLPFSPIQLGTGDWDCLSVHPSGTPLVAGNSSAQQLVSVNLAGSGATPAPGSPFTTGSALPFSCAFSRDGQYVYTGGNWGNNFAGYGVDGNTGVLTALPGSPFNSGNSTPVAYAFDGAGRLFLASIDANQVRAFTTEAGLPSPVLNNPFLSGLTEAVHGLWHPAGYYLVADRAGNRVGMYRIEGGGPSTTLTAVSGSPFTSGGTFTDVLALNRSGAYLFAANGNTRNITTFIVNVGNGALINHLNQPPDTLGANGRITGLAYAETPQPPTPSGSGFIYALEERSGAENRIQGFRVNELTGALTALSGFPLGTGGNGFIAGAFQQLAYDEANGRLYAVNDGSDTVTAYSVDRTTGSLAPLPFSPIPLGTGSWFCLAVDPAGSTLAAGNVAGLLAGFRITADSAVPAAGSPYATGTFPASCTFSRNGSHVYAGGIGPNIAGFGVDGNTGDLTALAGSPFDSGGSQAFPQVTDKTGRLFVSEYTAGKLRVFTLEGGPIHPVAGNPFPSGLTQAPSGLLHPVGYYLVADRIGNRVGVYRINGDGPDTVLAAVTGSPFPAGGWVTGNLALNRSGAFLFAANSLSHNITTYAFDQTTGALTGAGIQPWDAAGSGTSMISGMVYVPGADFLFLPLIRR